MGQEQAAEGEPQQQGGVGAVRDSTPAWAGRVAVRAVMAVSCEDGRQ